MGHKAMMVSPIVRSIRHMIVCLTLSCAPAHSATYRAVVTDLKSGQVLAGKDANIQAYPASLTKLMTLYLALEALTQKKVSLSTRIVMSSNAANQRPCKWGVNAHQSLSLRQCLAILTTRSANDIAVGLAENLASSQSSFVQRMNAKAWELGMHHTQFYNPSGWHHHAQKTTAQDMAILLRALCKDFPRYMHFLAIPFIHKGKVRMANTNKLLGRVPGVRLGKTGFTCPAGWNLATLTQRGGKSIITVVMGMPTGKSRDQHATHLIETFYGNPHNLQMAISQPAIPEQPLSLREKSPKTFLAQSSAMGKKPTLWAARSRKTSAGKRDWGSHQSGRPSQQKINNPVTMAPLTVSPKPALSLALVLQKNITQVESPQSMGTATLGQKIQMPVVTSSETRRKAPLVATRRMLSRTSIGMPSRTPIAAVKKKSNKMKKMMAKGSKSSKFTQIKTKPIKSRTTIA